ncbi:hypothetical protein ACOSQ2_030534 [Xanthoceras sorbifolium]
MAVPAQNLDHSSSSMSAGFQQRSGAFFSSPFNSQLNFNLPIKLNDNNYLFWKAQVLPAIRAYNMEDYIFEAKAAPVKYVEETSSEGQVSSRISNEFLVWKKNDQLLVCWLISTLSESVVGQVTRCVTTAFEVWSTLKNMYSQQSRSRILHLKSQMQSLRKGSMSITAYIMKMKGLADNLTAAGHLTTDQDVVMSAEWSRSRI